MTVNKNQEKENKAEKEIKKLFELNAHLGHKTNRSHPKAAKFIYKTLNGVSIIDLTKTVACLKKAKEFVQDLSKNSKKILFVVTKKNVSHIVTHLCKKSNLPFITVKWPAGFLTNFETLLKNIKKLKKMREEKERGEWNKFVKHEQISLQKQLNRLEKFYGGITQIEKLPDALIIIDIKKEKTALAEALKTKIPVIALVDTNVNPTPVTYPIPVNDDSPEAVEFIIKEIVNSYTNEKN